MGKKTLVIYAVLLVCTFTANAQNIFTAGLRNVPTVRFTFENPNVRPAKYEISVDAAGDAEYFEREEEAEPAEADRRRFQVSKPTRDRIFELTQALGQFRADFEFRKHRVAFTGHKTLTYNEGAEEYSTTFNWSENKEAMELAEIFQGIAATLHGESELRRLRKYDKLGLDAQLRTMEREAKTGWLKEIRVISKVLNEIKSDPAVMGMARARADRLLKLAGN